MPGPLLGQPALPGGKHPCVFCSSRLGAGDSEMVEIHLESCHESEAGGRNRSYDPVPCSWSSFHQASRVGRNPGAPCSQVVSLVRCLSPSIPKIRDLKSRRTWIFKHVSLPKATSLHIPTVPILARHGSPVFFLPLPQLPSHPHIPHTSGPARTLDLMDAGALQKAFLNLINPILTLPLPYHYPLFHLP